MSFSRLLLQGCLGKAVSTAPAQSWVEREGEGSQLHPQPLTDIVKTAAGESILTCNYTTSPPSPQLNNREKGPGSLQGLDVGCPGFSGRALSVLRRTEAVASRGPLSEAGGSLFPRHATGPRQPRPRHNISSAAAGENVGT